LAIGLGIGSPGSVTQLHLEERDPAGATHCPTSPDPSARHAALFARVRARVVMLGLACDDECGGRHMAGKDAKLDLLRRVPLFAACGGDSLGQIERLTDEVDVPDGYVLMRQGDIAQDFLLIVDGKVRIERDGETIASLGSGEFLGEIGLIDEGRRTASAVTEGPAKLLVITHQGFHSLLALSPAIHLEILKSLAGRIRQLEPEAPH
jgi:hypothetical protein